MTDLEFKELEKRIEENTLCVRPTKIFDQDGNEISELEDEMVDKMAERYEDMLDFEADKYNDEVDL